jgi:hypothetical protein
LQAAHTEDVEDELHNNDEGSGKAYHTQIGDGPIIPESEEEQLGACALLTADYLPEEIVDTQKGELSIRGSFGWEIAYLRREESLTSNVANFAGAVATPALVGAKLNEGLSGKQRFTTFLSTDGCYTTIFFRDFVFGQDLTQINRKLRKKFLASNDELAGIIILGQLSALASETATVKGRPLKQVYERMLRRGRLGAFAPQTAADCIFSNIGSDRGLRKQLPRLSRALIKLEEAAA